MRPIPVATLLVWGALVLLAAGFGVLMTAASGAPVIFPASAVVSTIVLAGVAWSGHVVGPSVNERRARLFGAFAAIGLAPAMMCLAAIALEDSRVYSVEKCGLAQIGWIFLGCVAFCFGVLLSTIVAIFAARRPFPSEEPLVRLLATLATGAALVAVSFATVRAARLPSLDSYLDSLPVVSRVPVLEEDAVSEEPIFTPYGAFARARNSFGCTVRRSTARPPSAENIALCAELEVRYDARAETFYFLAPYHLRGVLAAIDRDGNERTVGFAHLTPSVAAPGGWVLEAWAGVAIAIVALVRARAARRFAASRASWREVTLDANGWVHFSDGTPPRQLPSAIGIRPGPVLLDLRDFVATPYRDDGSRFDPKIYADSADGLRTFAGEQSLALASFALATIALACAPLVAAAFARIAF
jgi:hypothetical protein